MTGRAHDRFVLRYAAHLGFRSFDMPLFAHAARSPAPADQIAFAAGIGFAGIQDPWFSSRPEADRREIAACLRHHGLAAGSLVIGAKADLAEPLWLPGDRAGADRLSAAIDRAFRDAEALGATDLAIVPGRAPGLPAAEQEARFVERLHETGVRAASRGLRVAVEAIAPATLPNLLLTGFDQAARIVRAADHPAVRLIYDTGHQHATDGDLPGRLDREWEILGPVQIASQPGRCEPGAGTIDIAPLLAQLARRGHAGLVELEHLWLQPGREAELAGLSWLDAVEPAIRRAMADGSPQ
ncbi:MAG: TIM barrel protein [Sneathiellaceae bacterium]